MWRRTIFTAPFTEEEMHRLWKSEVVHSEELKTDITSYSCKLTLYALGQVSRAKEKSAGIRSMLGKIFPRLSGVSTPLTGEPKQVLIPEHGWFGPEGKKRAVVFTGPEYDGLYLIDEVLFGGSPEGRSYAQSMACKAVEPLLKKNSDLIESNVDFKGYRRLPEPRYLGFGVSNRYNAVEGEFPFEVKLVVARAKGSDTKALAS